MTEPRSYPLFWASELCPRCGQPRCAKDKVAMDEIARGHRAKCKRMNRGAAIVRGDSRGSNGMRPEAAEEN